MQVRIPGYLIFKSLDSELKEQKVVLKILENLNVEEIKTIISLAFNNLEKGSFINKIIAANIDKFEIQSTNLMIKSMIFNEEDNDINFQTEKGFIYTINSDTNDIYVIYDYDNNFQEIFTGKIEDFIK